MKPSDMTIQEVRRLTQQQYEAGTLGRVDQIKIIAQLEEAEAQKTAARAAERNALYMLWSVIIAASSTIITAASIGFNLIQVGH